MDVADPESVTMSVGDIDPSVTALMDTLSTDPSNVLDGVMTRFTDPVSAATSDRLAEALNVDVDPKSYIDTDPRAAEIVPAVLPVIVKSI